MSKAMAKVEQTEVFMFYICYDESFLQIRLTVN